MKTSPVLCFMAALAVLAGGCGVAGVADPSLEQQPTAEELGFPAVITNSIGMKLVLIPAGEFMMGEPAPEEGRNSDGQQHRVRITRSFYLGAYEVTQQQYERVMGVNPSRFKGPQHPVESVGWDEAVELCHKLSAMPEEKAAGRVYRLPTEAEWEYACRAAATTHYAFGDNLADLGDNAWFSETSSSTTHPVGEKRPNAWGLYDMYGNVWEWCADWYDGEYANSRVDDPTGPATGSARVARGGGWFYPASRCWPAYRNGGQPSLRSNYLGFRVAAVPSASKASPVSPAGDDQ